MRETASCAGRVYCPNHPSSQEFLQQPNVHDSRRSFDDYRCGRNARCAGRNALILRSFDGVGNVSAVTMNFEQTRRQLDERHPGTAAANDLARPHGPLADQGVSAPDVQSLRQPLLSALLDPALDPLFTRPTLVGVPSGWWSHVPFAYWIVQATAPRVLVELGTYTGVSYAGFCQAVLEAGLPTRCHAVDHWRGDHHAGEYGEEVYEAFRDFHDARYERFSTLLRCTFDAALAWFSDSSIDLLHIDGLHSYDAVRHDFENWLPKLSQRGIVLLHDTNVRRDDFGVWRLWEELQCQYPSFQFLHGYGLGVLAVGNNVPAAVQALCRLTNPQAIAALRNRFAVAGERCSEAEQLDDLLQHTAQQASESEQLRAEIARLEAFAAEQAAMAQAAQEAASRTAETLDQARAEVAALSTRLDRLRESSTPLRYSVRLFWPLARRSGGGQGGADG
jgi:hypothetical protein